MPSWPSAKGLKGDTAFVSKYERGLAQYLSQRRAVSKISVKTPEAQLLLTSTVPYFLAYLGAGSYPRRGDFIIMQPQPLCSPKPSATASPRTESENVMSTHPHTYRLTAVSDCQQRE